MNPKEFTETPGNPPWYAPVYYDLLKVEQIVFVIVTEWSAFT